MRSNDPKQRRGGGGFMNTFRGRRFWRLVLAIGSLFFIFSSFQARGDVACAEGVGCEEPLPLDRGYVTSIVGEPRGTALSGEALAQRTHAIGLLLRCTTCQGSSVSDSPSSAALNMRQEVADLLAEGFDEEQILAYFEAAYGQFVLLQPKAEGVGMLVWLAPGLLLLVGGGFLVTYFRRGAAAEDEAPAADLPAVSRGTLPDDEELSRWVKKVRELAYGWPGGEPPAEGGAS